MGDLEELESSGTDKPNHSMGQPCSSLHLAEACTEYGGTCCGMKQTVTQSPLSSRPGNNVSGWW